MYDYEFNFPAGYDPNLSEDADDYYFCETTFNKYITIIESCVFHVKGPLTGTTLILEKWQRDIVAALFCLLHKETGKRRYGEAFIYVPRKNGKSMFCSALVVAYLILDSEKGKQVVSVAGSSDQASLIYKPIRISLLNEKSPLKDPSNTNPNRRFKVLGNPRKIISENELNEYLPLTADGDRNHGLNVSLSVMDEIHTWKQKQGASLYEAVVTSGGMRQSPLNIIITTADYNRDSICNDKFNHGLNVAQNITDDSTFLPVLYYLDKTEDWTSEKAWYKCNPQCGKSIPIDFYRREVKKAQLDPTYTNSFKRLYLNIQTQSETKFLDFLRWKRCKTDPVDLSGLECYGGLDLAFKYDLCTFVLLFPFGDKIHVLTKMWLPEEHPQIRFYRSKNWIEDGFIKTTSGNGIDFKTVKEDIVEMCQDYLPVEIGFDPRFATELCQSLYSDFDLPMVEVNQSPKNLSEALKDIAVCILDDKFRHLGNECADWQVSNATQKEYDGGMIKLVKPQGKDSTLAKVDFVAALNMAHNRYLFNETEDFSTLLESTDYSMF